MFTADKTQVRNQWQQRQQSLNNNGGEEKNMDKNIGFLTQSG